MKEPEYIDCQNLAVLRAMLRAAEQLIGDFGGIRKELWALENSLIQKVCIDPEEPHRPDAG